VNHWYLEPDMPGIEFKPLEIADVLKLIGALTVFALGLYQYAQAQKWKRREFIAAQIKEFEANKDIQIMMTILDWTDRKVYFPSEAGGDPVELRVDDQVLCSALLPHEAAGRYDRYEVLIRDRVDRFLEMLVRLENFVDARLISVDELRPYMHYWIKLIAGQMPGWHSPEVFILLLNYIQRYGFDGAAELIKQFGYEPVPPKAAVDQAIAQIVALRARSDWHVVGDAAIAPPVPADGC